MSSVGGERLCGAVLDHQGVVGDRKCGLIDVVTGLAAAPEKELRWRKALFLQARCHDGHLPFIEFPDGHIFSATDPSLISRLSDFFGFPAALAVYEHTEKSSAFPLARQRHQHFPMHLVTTASLKQLAALQHVEEIDIRRFRPTVLIDARDRSGFIESEWIGRQLRLGGITLTARDETKRCGVTFIAQPGLEEDPDILRSILRNNRRNFGIYCSIDGCGTIQVGDELTIQI